MCRSNRQARRRRLEPDCRDTSRRTAIPARLRRRYNRLAWIVCWASDRVRSAGRPRCGEWTYGLVKGYTAASEGHMLRVQVEDASCRASLAEPPGIIKVDLLNYVLQTGGTTNAMMNAHELLEVQSEVIAVCRKSHSGPLLAQLAPHLTVPFDPETIVALIRPDTLRVVSVRRSHVLGSKTSKSRTKRPCDVFDDADALLSSDPPRHQRIVSVPPKKIKRRPPRSKSCLTAR